MTTVQELEQRVEELENQVHQRPRHRSIRWRSDKILFGLPMCDVAIGPDKNGSELRGHARGFVAVGDYATGVIAIGGIAKGGIAIGGLACGLLSVGGCAFGLLGVLGGVALGGYAVGGVAIGLKAIGGVVVQPGWFTSTTSVSP